MKTALGIADDMFIRQTLHDLLEKANFKAETAEDGWDGVKMIKKKDYDLVLLDIRMPDVDGEQVLGIISKFKKSTPIIIVSGHLTKVKVMNLVKLGAKGFLTKPIKIDKFFAMVKEVCPG